MKRFRFWLAALALLLALCGCQEQGNPNIYDVAYNGKTYSVDQEQGTITCDGVVYSFTISTRGGSSVDFEVTYPDGSRYYRTGEDYFGHGGWTEDYDPEEKGYVPGDELWDVLDLDRSTSSGRSGSPLVGIFLLVLGGLLAAQPRLVWMLEYGWRFKSVEPSDLALSVHRIMGVVLIVAGVIYLLALLL